MIPSRLLQIIERGELFPSLLILLGLSVVGARSVKDRTNLDRIGRQLGLATLLAYVAFRIHTYAPTTSEELLWILLRGMGAAMFVTSSSWILLPVGVDAWFLTGARFVGALSSAMKWHRDRNRERQSSGLIRQQRLASHRETEQSSPERERQRKEAEARVRLEREAAETAFRRREEARLRSELLYERHARQLASSFPRERFEQFLERYLDEGTPPELVEQREQLLKETVLDSLGTTTAPKFGSMTELANFFEARRQEIEQLPHPQDVKDAYVVQLNKQEDESLKRFLKP